MVICYLGVGSNLGNRKKNIREAIKKINALKGARIMKESRLFNFCAVGGPCGQPNFLNAALKIQTKFSALNLLKKLKKIEKDLGRTKTARFAPRVIDLDILFYGNKFMRSKLLTIPHPRMFKRDFVIKPLQEVL